MNADKHLKDYARELRHERRCNRYEHRARRIVAGLSPWGSREFYVYCFPRNGEPFTFAENLSPGGAQVLADRLKRRSMGRPCEPLLQRHTVRGETGATSAHRRTWAGGTGRERGGRAVREINWDNPPKKFVLGYIDSHGAIHARESDTGMHTDAERLAGRCFRWGIWSQNWVATIAAWNGEGRLEREDYDIIAAWLEDMGYKEPAPTGTTDAGQAEEERL